MSRVDAVAELKASVPPEVFEEIMAEIDAYTENYKKELIKIYTGEFKDFNQEHDPETGRFTGSGEGGSGQDDPGKNREIKVPKNNVGVKDLPNNVSSIYDLDDKDKENLSIALTHSFATATGMPKTSVIYRMAGEKLHIAANSIEGTPGSLERTIDFKKGIVEHETFLLPVKMQAHDLGKKVLGQQIEAYQQLGLKAVELVANANIGGYAWAKYGFIPNKNDWNYIRGTALEVLESDFGVKEKEAPEVFAALKSDNPKGIWVVADSTFPIKEWDNLPLGKTVLVDTKWEGRLNLKHKESMERFHRYVGKTKSN